nr:MAG TPA: hypothetical protein [Caudoviricetes sp.]
MFIFLIKIIKVCTKVGTGSPLIELIFSKELHKVLQD